MLVSLVVLAVLVLSAPFLLRLVGRDGRIWLPAKTTYTSGQYYAFANPWGAEDRRLLEPWSRQSETIWIDHRRFPGNTQVNWIWPPFAPRNGVGVWGYHHVGYGYYDGGGPEKSVTPRQVKAIKALDCTFAWDGSFLFGQATVLNEFYLRTDPRKNESKTLEIGWLLHFSSNVRTFLETAKPIGEYLDKDNRRWSVKMFEKYVIFSPANGEDLRSGRIDMLGALRWLQARKMISGDEWVTGLAFGAEPIKGFGSVEIQKWDVDFR